LSFIAVTVAGDYLLSFSSITSPFLAHPLYLQVRENKYAFGIGAWMVGNMITQSLTSTGAFEVVYKGKVIFSKLEQRRMPNVDEIIKPLKKFRFNTQFSLFFSCLLSFSISAEIT